MTAAVDDDDGGAAAVELVRRAGRAVGDDAPRRVQLESLARSQPVGLAGHQAQIVGQDVLGGLAASARERRHEDARDVQQERRVHLQREPLHRHRRARRLRARGVARAEQRETFLFLYVCPSAAERLVFCHRASPRDRVSLASAQVLQRERRQGHVRQHVPA